MNAATERFGTAEGVRLDLRWLHEAWMVIRDTPFSMVANTSESDGARWDRFAERLHTCAGSDEALRKKPDGEPTGFTGCVWKPKACPTTSPYRCRGCTAIEEKQERMTL